MKTKNILTLLLLFCCVKAYPQLNHKHYILMGRIELSEENFTSTIQNLNMAIAAKPNDFEAYFLRGIAKYSLNDYKGAVDDFTTTLKIHPLYVRAYHYRGVSNDHLGNYADAKSDFNKAIKLDPFDAELHMAIGSTKMHLNEFEDAIASFDTALIISPNNANAYIYRGTAKRYLDRREDAIKDLNKAVYYDFFNVEALVRRGMIQMECENYEDALLDFNSALKMDASNPIIYFNRGNVFLNLGDTIAALKDYERVNNIDERNALTYFNRAIIYSVLNEYDIALALYDKVIEINPNNIYGYFNRGILFYKMKEWDNAEDDFTKTIELFPDFIDAWVNRSVVRYEKGDIQGAELDRLKSMEIINLINKDENNIDSLFNVYSKSIEYDDILAFESDFVEGDKGGKLAQFSTIDIKPFNNIIVTVVEFDSKNKYDRNNNYFIDAALSVINENNTLDRLQLAYKIADIFSDDYQSLLNDSIIDNVEDEDLKTFLKGVANYEIHNYHHSESEFRSLLGDENLDLYAAMNIASLQQDRAELLLADQNYNERVTISNKKNNNNSNNITPLSKPNYDKALNTLTDLVEEYPKNPFVWYNLGNVHLHMQEFHEAIDDYSQAIKYENNLAEAYYNRGLTLLFLGERELANKDLSKAGELGIKEAYAVIKRYF